MTESEVASLIKLNMANYPGRFLPNATKDEFLAMKCSWHMVLKDLPADVVLDAYHQALTNCEFPVTPANIFKVLREQAQATLPNVEKLWYKLCRVADYCHYESSNFEYTNGHIYRQKCQERYDKLPQVCKDFIGGLSRAVSFGSMNDIRREDIHFGRFRRFVEGYQAQQISDVSMLAAAQEAKLLEGGQDG